MPLAAESGVAEALEAMDSGLGAAAAIISPTKNFSLLEGDIFDRLLLA
jgi:hypothetical protein